MLEPESPRARSEERNLPPGLVRLAGLKPKPYELLHLVPGHPHRDHERHRADPVVGPDLEVGHVHHDEQVVALDAPRAELLDGPVERGAGLGDRRVGQAPVTDRLHELAHLRRRSAAQDHLRHGGHKGGLAALVVVEHHGLEGHTALPRAVAAVGALASAPRRSARSTPPSDRR